MHRLARIHATLSWVGIALLFSDAAVAAEPHQVPAPQIDRPWWQIAGNPDLGELTSCRQQPVDFAVWQAADGTWQLWSCIRGTKCGGQTRLLYRWEGKDLTSPDWTPMGIAMQADPALGETEGGLQAPHVVKVDGTYHMFYGDWEHICHAVSDDGKTFERVVQPSGRTGMFTEGEGTNTRDIMMLQVGDVWHGYYTAFPNRQGAVFVRTTRDFENWSESTTVAFGGLTGTNPTAAECPHVVERNGRYYLFRTQRYGRDHISTVYHSRNPKMFGINQDRRYLLTRLPVAAPEIVRHEGQDYIAALNPGLDGIRVARLTWETPPKPAEPVFDFEDPATRKQWTVQSGNLAGAFTDSRRTDFSSPMQHFVGTAELDGRQFDDDLTGVVVSPVFAIEDEQYIAYISGGDDRETLYVALVDEETGDELLRVAHDHDDNRMSPEQIDVGHLRDRRVYLKVVDKAQGSWGHINFGGLYRVR